MPDPSDEEFDELLHYLDTFEKDAKAFIDAEEQNPTHFGTESPTDLASFIAAADLELGKITDEILASDVSPILKDEHEPVDEEGLNKTPDLTDKTVDELEEELDLFLKTTEEEFGMTAPSDQSTADNTDDENKVPFDEAFVEKIDEELRAAVNAALSSNPIEWPEEEDDEDLDPNINEQDMKDFMDKELSLQLEQAAPLLQAPTVKPDDTAVQGHLKSLFLDFDTALGALESKGQALGTRGHSKDSKETLMLCENLSNLKEAFLKEPTQENLKIFSDMCEKLIVDAQTSRINAHRGNNPIAWIQSLAGEDTDTMKKVREVKTALGKIKLSEPEAKSDDATPSTSPARAPK